jgi:subtilisin family serine protease
MRAFLVFAFLCWAAPAAASDWPDATPTAWHQLARAESLLSAPEPPNPVAVCIVDSGVNLTPDLAPVVIERLAYDGGDPGDTYPQEGIDDGHGTYVATFLAGQVNGWGGAGLWPRAKIVSVRVFPPGGKRANVYDYVEALRTCRQHPSVGVINLSLGGLIGTDQEMRELGTKISQLRLEENINVVAAAGNRGGEVEIPAAYGPAFAVGAAEPGGGRLCGISARGPALDILAPGCGLEGADSSGKAATFSGTSFAAPMVSAAIAAIRAYTQADADEAERLLLVTAGGETEYPMLDVESALRAAGCTCALAQTKAAEGSTVDAPPATFRVLPTPKGTAVGWRTKLVVTVRNRPAKAWLEVAVAGRIHQGEASRIRIRVRARAKSIRLRYLDDEGVSEWKTVRVVKPRRRGDAERALGGHQSSLR